MTIEILGNTLDKEQTKCALTNNCHNIIIAGAGSGKSLTMVGKIKYLVQEKHIDIKDILCLTFTNDAALSLQNKISKCLNISTTVYTFHKLALEILQNHHVSYSIAPADLLDYLTYEVLTSINNPTYFEHLFATKDYILTKDFTNYCETIIRFIRLYICNNYPPSYFLKLIKKASRKDQPYLKLIHKIYEIYTLEKTSQGLIDFDDMIYLATKIVQEKGINANYKYIIIDEYQDTSKVRENLIKEIVNKTHSYLTVVGDDFQSIYRFSGCDINNFLLFHHNFKPAKKLYLTTTYRNSKELIKVAGSFIMKNPRQVKKHLTSSKTLTKPLVILYYQNIKADFLKALKYLNSPNLMILGRNNHDIYTVIDSKYLDKDQIHYEHYHAYYKTIHRAKGLEEDNVLIINLTNNINSLPSKIKEEHILKYVLIHKDTYPYEEERRLFYVALTRTKNYCYLFVDKENPSLFITELLKNYRPYLTIINL